MAMELNDFNSNLSLTASHFALTVISGWAIKNVDIKSTYSMIYFILTCFYGVFGLIRYTKPGKHHTNKSLCYCIFVQILGLGIYTFDILSIAHLYNRILFIITIMMPVIVGITQFLQYKKLKVYAVYGTVLWVIYVLSYVSMKFDECYWLIGTIMLLIINYFILFKISILFCISYLELCSVGFCFFNIFALNSINEISQKV